MFDEAVLRLSQYPPLHKVSAFVASSAARSEEPYTHLNFEMHLELTVKWRVHTSIPRLLQELTVFALCKGAIPNPNF